MSILSRTMPRHEASGKFRERSLFDREQQDIQTRFEAFDREHPEVWDLFMQFAHELLAAGHKHYSADAILHRIRWHFDVNAARAPGTLKINDHYSSRYARKLMRSAPRLFGDFFTVRTLTS